MEVCGQVESVAGPLRLHHLRDIERVMFVAAM
jgi:hypothetical protein